jgi:hypothetical protein
MSERIALLSCLVWDRSKRLSNKHRQGPAAEHTATAAILVASPEAEPLQVTQDAGAYARFTGTLLVLVRRRFG